MRWVASLVLLAATAGAAAGAPEKGPFAEVPRSDPAYGMVARLEAQGYFTGYPAGTFSGGRLITRYEFAVALQRMFYDVQRAMPGPVYSEESRLRLEVARRYPLGPEPAGSELLRLAQEFSSELAMVGSDVERLKRKLEALVTPRHPAAALPARTRTAEGQRGWEQGR